LERYPKAHVKYWPSGGGYQWKYRVPVDIEEGEVRFETMMNIEIYPAGNLISVPTLLRSGYSIEFGEDGCSFGKSCYTLLFIFRMSKKRVAKT
jgi:hypothetical protein